MASSRTGYSCACFATTPKLVPSSMSSSLPSVFNPRARRYNNIGIQRNASRRNVCRNSVSPRVTGEAISKSEKTRMSNILSASVAPYAVSDSCEFKRKGGSDIGTFGTFRLGAELGNTLRQKLKQYGATVLLLSCFQLASAEAVIAMESSSFGMVHESTLKETARGEFNKPSRLSAISLSIDLENSAADSAPNILSAPSSPEVRNPNCSKNSVLTVAEDASQDSRPVTNESIVEEAWQVVNENFLDARRHSWSAEEWLKRKEEALKRPLRSRMAAYGAIKAMLGSLNDPYTRFLTPDQFLQLSKYDVTGIGLNIGEFEENGTTSLRVLGIVLGSPAQSMGVRQGDELVAVNETSVRGMSAFEAASLIQGPKGTPVSIQIRHGPCEEIQSLTVSREQDVRTPVFYRLERTPNSLTGYIRLKEFNALAKRDLVTAMKRLQDAGATSFLLDLQDNPGGLVQAGIEIARLFLDGGETIIQTVGRDPLNYKSIMATGTPLTKAPLMVLVNDRTASASEIVAAALHDNCRAVLVGNRTFGKGLIQSVYELSDGSGIILTVGKYVTPGHVDIDRNGIDPDFRNPPGLTQAMDKLASCELKLQNAPSATSIAF
ncbi:hypothetical protein R1sor_021733 [Riccia sorocarpa]|uniref:C-terminal processing peptidase n=1 Tax=Riccia sorocarpa TaxID=122646 RepID=A0ABD3GJT2_9MARC